MIHNKIFHYFSQCLSYGVVLRELQTPEEACTMFVRSLRLTPLLWASWRELARLCKNREMVSLAKETRLHQYSV